MLDVKNTTQILYFTLSLTIIPIHTDSLYICKFRHITKYLHLHFTDNQIVP